MKHVQKTPDKSVTLPNRNMSEILLEKELLKLPFHIPLPVDGSDSEPVSMFCDGTVNVCIDFLE